MISPLNFAPETTKVPSGAKKKSKKKNVNIKSMKYFCSNVETFINIITKLKKNKQKIVNIKSMKYFCSNVETFINIFTKFKKNK